MRIGELANITSTTTKTLRFYEEAGLLTPPARSDNGYRDYPESAVHGVRFVRAGQAVGSSLAQIRELLALRHDGRPPCAAATQLLDNRIADISQKIDELEALQRDLRQLRSLADGLDPADCDPHSICHIINPEVCQCGRHMMDPEPEMSGTSRRLAVARIGTIVVD